MISFEISRIRDNANGVNACETSLARSIILMTMLRVKTHSLVAGGASLRSPLPYLTWPLRRSRRRNLHIFY